MAILITRRLSPASAARSFSILSAKIAESIEKLRVALAGDNRRVINIAMDDLGYETQEFAHRRMNQSVNRALSGRKVADIKMGEEA